LLIPYAGHITRRSPSPACGGGLGWGLFMLLPVAE
jgi:hypothetical protein